MIDNALLGDTYRADGVVSPVDIVTTSEVDQHLGEFERAESQLGPLHYCDKIHTILPSAFELVTNARVLAVVTELIGPDILVYNSSYIVKEPRTPTFVAWHQDLTYWGLVDDDAQVAMWLAITPATAKSGCMEMIAGSHRHGRAQHTTNTETADGNLLLLGQHIDDLDTTAAAHHPLQPGQASFHHGWTIHRSQPNHSAHRRIGLNVQFIAPPQQTSRARCHRHARSRRRPTRLFPARPETKC